MGRNANECIAKENAQALVAPGRFVVEGSFQRSENASRGQGFLAVHLVPALAPFNCLVKVFFAATRLPRRRSFREHARFLGVSGCVSSARRR